MSLALGPIVVVLMISYFFVFIPLGILLKLMVPRQFIYRLPHLIQMSFRVHEYHYRIHNRLASYFNPCRFLYMFILFFMFLMTAKLLCDTALPITYVFGRKMEPVVNDSDVLIIQGKSQFSIELGDIIVFRNESNPFWRQSGSMGYVDSFLSSYQSKYNVLVRKVHNKQDSNGNTRFLVCTEERDLTMAEKCMWVRGRLVIGVVQHILPRLAAPIRIVQILYTMLKNLKPTDKRSLSISSFLLKQGR